MSFDFKVFLTDIQYGMVTIILLIILLVIFMKAVLNLKDDKLLIFKKAFIILVSLVIIFAIVDGSDYKDNIYGSFFENGTYKTTFSALIKNIEADDYVKGTITVEIIVYRDFLYKDVEMYFLEFLGENGDIIELVDSEGNHAFGEEEYVYSRVNDKEYVLILLD